MSGSSPYTVSFNDIEIAYDQRGAEDAQPILFLHGFPLSNSMWCEQTSLEDTHRLILPDLRGHGGSSVTEGVVTMADMADDMRVLVDSLELPSVIACGLSMGGYVAWEFWRRHRARLKALILCDTRAVADTEEVARGREMMAAMVVKQGSGMAADSMVPKLMAAQTYEREPDTVELIRNAILRTKPQGIAATQLGMAKRVDMTSELPDIDVPTLVLCGSEDAISPPAEMSDFAGKMPNAKYVEIADAGHLAPLEQPSAVNVAIREFLANI